MAIKRRTGTVKSPPILSHEFFIQNHADIISCLAMIIVVSLLFQATSPYAAYFVALQHNTTEVLGNPLALYSSGPKDFCVIFFYFLISIVIHAVVQEYIIDKINRKLHLSKTKHSKFNESGQLLVFYVLSILWAGEILRREGFILSLQRLWSDYPERHVEMPYINKYYFIVQISYWLHSFPELYFQKVKRDELIHRASYSMLYLFFFMASYYMNFTRIALCLSLIHYLSESLFHLSRLLDFSNKTKLHGYIFKIWNVIFVLVRFLSISLSVLTFWYGFAATSSSSIDFVTGNFNTPLIRLFCLAIINLLQAWMMLNFITFHLQRLRERAAEIARRKKNVLQQRSTTKTLDSDINELPEVDQQQTTTTATTGNNSTNSANNNSSKQIHSPKSAGKLKIK